MASQFHEIEITAKTVVHLLDNYGSHPNAVICYHASGMILEVHSNASYFSKKEAHNRAGGHFFIGNKHNNQFNGPIHITSIILQNVMASEAEAELVVLFENEKEATPIYVLGS
eukprot:3391979-Ditylum_brightwellii.AAC.1